jgi:hypothetical protein
VNKNDKVDLFVISTRGLLTEAFARSNVSPGEYWPVLRGEKEPTMRDIGEIGFVTGLQMKISFEDISEAEYEETHEEAEETPEVKELDVPELERWKTAARQVLSESNKDDFERAWDDLGRAWDDARGAMLKNS